MPVTNLLLGFAIGLILGLLGGGGSILTVPAMVYLVGQTPQTAVTTSLAVVGANSMMGVFFHRQHGTLNWNVALGFGGVGFITAFLAADISEHLPASLLMVSFASLMLVIGGIMIAAPQLQQERNSEPSIWIILISGALVGLLTGVLGVGGGFLIVPALVILVGLPIQQAVGTSLIVIAINSLAGLLGHLGSASLDVSLLLAFIGAGLVGTFVGANLSQRVPAQHLRKGFALFVMVLACFLLYDNVSNLL